MNKARERRPYSTGDKLPESTGDNLQDLLGIRIPIFLGKLFRLYWGVGIPPRNNLRSRLPGMFVDEMPILHWGMLISSGDTQLPSG